MTQRITANEVHSWLRDYFDLRPDIGLGKTILSLALHPRNPFDSRARRKPRAGFVLGVVLFATAAICFCYFNLAD
jgi:hypothetical protein